MVTGRNSTRILLATLVLLVGLMGEILVPQSSTETANSLISSAQATTSEDGEERTRTRSATSWVASTAAWVWSNCTGIVPTVSDPHNQRQCQERTRTVGAWSNGSFSTSSCSPATNEGTYFRQCESQTRPISSWSSWSSWSYSNCSYNQRGETSSGGEQQCSRRTRTRTAWQSPTSWSYSSCSSLENTTGSYQRQCQSRQRTTWGGGSWTYNPGSCGSYPMTSAYYNNTNSTQHLCAVGIVSWSSSTTAWAWNSCSRVFAMSNESWWRDCESRNWGWGSLGSVTSSCSASTSASGGPARCRHVTWNTSTGALTYGSWSFNSCSGSGLNFCQRQGSVLTSTVVWNDYSSCNTFLSPTGGSNRSCRSRTSNVTGVSFASYDNHCHASEPSIKCRTYSRTWSESSWSFSNCSPITAGNHNTRPRQCRSRDRTWAAWSNPVSEGWVNCTGNEGFVNQTQCRSRNRSVGSYTNNGFGPDSASCSPGYNDGTVQRRCRNRTRSISAWSSATAWSDTATCVFFQTGNSSNTETQCRTRDRQRAWGPWGPWSAWASTATACVVGSSVTETSIGGPEVRSGSQEQTQCREGFTYNPSAPTGAAFRGPLRPT